MKQEYKERLYKLKTKNTPLSMLIAARNSRHKPLVYFDEEKGYNRALRYATNQKSVFEDEQDGHVIVGAVIFEDGFLKTRKEDVVLQQFLNLHPDNGILFEEVDTERDAQEDLEYINYEVDALIAAREMEIDQMEAIARVALGIDVEKVKTAELKRDILVFARNNPQEFLEALDNDDITLESMVKRMFTENLLSYRRKNREVYFNLKNNKKRMLLVKHGEDYVKSTMAYFHTEEGMEALDTLENKLNA